MWADSAGRALALVRRATWLLVTLSAAAACGGSASQVRAPVDRSPAGLYPLATGYAWSYDVDPGDGSSVLAIARVVSMQAGVAVVVTGAGAEQRYQVSAGGIARAGQGGHLLKAPIELGASWEAGPDTVARVASVSEQVQTPAGSFADCVRIDESNAASGQRIATTYCPGVGPASVISEMDVRGQTLRVTARLRGYALEADASGTN
jgi:hypothetical protein